MLLRDTLKMLPRLKSGEYRCISISVHILPFAIAKLLLSWFWLSRCYYHGYVNFKKWKSQLLFYLNSFSSLLLVRVDTFYLLSCSCGTFTSYYSVIGTGYPWYFLDGISYLTLMQSNEDLRNVVSLNVEIIFGKYIPRVDCLLGYDGIFVWNVYLWLKSYWAPHEPRN